jgi:predicted nucleotidyltransferase
MILQKIADELKTQYQPTRLILYGSRANLTHKQDSDYDFVMVLKEFDAKNRMSMMQKISKYFSEKMNISVQVWTYSEAEFNDWKDEFSSIPETALNTGKAIRKI